MNSSINIIIDIIYDIEKVDFISFVEKKFFEDGWSLDACVGCALKEGLFTRDQIVCTKTLYDYTDLGLLGIKNIDLPEKLETPASPQERTGLRKQADPGPEYQETSIASERPQRVRALGGGSCQRLKERG